MKKTKQEKMIKDKTHKKNFLRLACSFDHSVYFPFMSNFN